MTEAIKDVIMATTVVEIGSGFVLAQVAAVRPMWVPGRFRPLVKRWRRSSGGRVRLFFQGMGWLVVTAVSAALLIPVLPMYAAFKWIDSLYQATSPLFGRSEEAFDDMPSA